ncbi:MAG: nucleoside recognition protein [Clostridiales bacterium]|nr:nucleoside recognition protein [Clostridiales bacterium]
MIAILFLILLLLDPAVSVAGALHGLQLWFNVVLPTLAPFIICTRAILADNVITLLMRPFHPVFHRLFGLSISGTFVMLCGLLCGYPLGAKLCADSLKENRISQAEARYLFSICNHPSPMFVLGYVRSCLPFSVSALFLVVCLYLPILPLSLLSRRFYGWKGKTPLSSHGYAEPARTQFDAQLREPPVSLEDILASTSDTMILIGSYIMLFSILSAWIEKLTFLPAAAQAFLAGSAEITTGVKRIAVLLPDRRALVPTLLCISFGGISGIFQTGSVIKKNPDAQDSSYGGLSVRHYLCWKLLHATLSGITAALLASLPFH